MFLLCAVGVAGWYADKFYCPVVVSVAAGIVLTLGVQSIVELEPQLKVERTS
jgi:hypothetical protein